MKRFISWLAAVSFITSHAQAQLGGTSAGDPDVRISNTTSEYVFRSTYRENLVPVQLLGAVNKPGLYFVPPRTDLVKLMTLAGGMQTAADDSIIVRKADQSWQKVDVQSSSGVRQDGSSYAVDMQKVLKKNKYTDLTMSAHDVVYVPAKDPWISQDAYRTVSLVSLAMSIVLTGVLIDQNAKRR